MNVIKAWNRKTHETFLDDLKRKSIEYTPLEEYKGESTKILFQCNKCGNIWSAKPTNILSGRGCPKCRDLEARKRWIYSHEKFCELVSEKNPNVEIIGEYTGYKNKIKVRCKRHGIEWEPLPNAILRGCGCSKCMKERISEKNGRTHDEFVKIVSETSPHIEILGRYKNVRKKIKVRCKNHDEIYYVTPDLLVHGGGNCPKCTMTSGEYKVANYLDSMGYEYISQYSFANSEVSRKRFDFYIPSANTCIEYDGIQHFEPVANFGGEDRFDYIKKSDEEKNEYCKSHNINLIRIPYTVEDVGNFLSQNGI